MSQDKSPLVPDLGPVHLSNLFQRRLSSKEMLSDSYIRFEDYDNLSELSVGSLSTVEFSHEFMTVSPLFDDIEKKR